MALIRSVFWCLCAFVVFLGSTGKAQQTPKPEMFPFVIPWDDASKTVTDVSSLNPAPLDDSRRISVKGPHFEDETGRRAKFLCGIVTLDCTFSIKKNFV